MEQRDAFVFYRSFFEAVEKLEEKDQAPVLLAVCDYALNGNERVLSGVPAAIFMLIKPNLDSSRKKAIAGFNGGKSKSEAERKQNGSKQEANSKQTASKPEATRDKGQEIKDKGQGIDITPLTPQEGDEQANQNSESLTVEKAEDWKSPSTTCSNSKKVGILSAKQQELFICFWSAYPRKSSKGQAEKAWKKLNPDSNLLSAILAGLEQAKRLDHRFQDAQYIPHPASWLNGRDWENEYEGGAANGQSGTNNRTAQASGNNNPWARVGNRG